MVQRSKTKTNFIQLLTSNGNKATSEKIFLNLIKISNKNFKKNFFSLTKLVIKNRVSILSVLKIKKRKHSIILPFFLKKSIRTVNSIKSIIANSRTKKNDSIEIALYKECYDSLYNKTTKKNYQRETHILASTNKNFATYRWF
jgi:ribosomal protein S7